MAEEFEMWRIFKQKEANIVNIRITFASTGDLSTLPSAFDKAGVMTMTQALALE